VIKNVTQIWSGYKLQYGVFQISGAVSDPSICEVFFVLSSEKVSFFFLVLAISFTIENEAGNQRISLSFLHLKSSF